MIYETFERRNDYIAIHKAACGHLRKHRRAPKNLAMYRYSQFASLFNAHAYAQSTGLHIKMCRCT